MKLIKFKTKTSVIKHANRTDQITNMMVPFCIILSGISIGGVVGLACVITAIPFAYMAYTFPLALSRFSYAAATDKWAFVKAGYLALVTVAFTTVGIVGAGTFVNTVAEQRSSTSATILKGTQALLSDRVLDKCDSSKSADCVEKDHIQKAISQAKEIAAVVPPFSFQQVQIGFGKFALSGTALITLLAIMAAIALALIQCFLPFHMAKSNQGTPEEILDGVKIAA